MNFNHLMGFIPFHLWQMTAFGRLFGTDAGDPALHALQGARERFYFADITTQFPVFHRFVKTVGSFFIHQLLYIGRLGEIHVDAFAVVFKQAFHQRVGFRKKPARVEGEDGYGQLLFPDHIGNHLIFPAQAAGETEGLFGKPGRQCLQNSFRIMRISE
ncbi:MAG: hypothetical protein AA908_10225 [Chlorobi bacterium NICIL-2]|nr:MAG: hypothetical protein AA908_10225 [Chlorobi bacterium NICIL-2]